jgi:hypothetical protein
MAVDVLRKYEKGERRKEEEWMKVLNVGTCILDGVGSLGDSMERINEKG